MLDMLIKKVARVQIRSLINSTSPNVINQHKEEIMFHSSDYLEFLSDKLHIWERLYDNPELLPVLLQDPDDLGMFKHILFNLYTPSKYSAELWRKLEIFNIQQN